MSKPANSVLERRRYVPAFHVKIVPSGMIYNAMVDGEDFGHFGASPDEALGCAVRHMILSEDSPIHLTVTLRGEDETDGE